MSLQERRVDARCDVVGCPYEWTVECIDHEDEKLYFCEEHALELAEEVEADGP